MAASTVSPGFIRRTFLEHPASVGESYFEHAKVASHFGRKLAKASVMAFVHAAVPGKCCTSASETIKELHAELMVGARGEIHGEAGQVAEVADGPTPRAAAS